MQFFSASTEAIRRVPLNEWLERVITTDVRRRAHGVFEGAIAQLPELVRYRMTPQTPPHHAEGPNVAYHVERILACVLAIEDGEHVSDIEELSRNHDDRLAIQELEDVIRQHAAFFKVFALVHDAAKPDTVSFSAPESSKGAAEGFLQHAKRSESTATPKEIARFDKIIRAFAASRPNDTPEEISIAFFHEYAVSAHYDDHDRKGAGPQFELMRVAAMDLFGVEASFHKLLAEIIWNHIDAIRFFDDEIAPAKYAFLEARARKLGLNPDVFLTFLSAAVLLDAVLGSLGYENGKLQPNVAPILHLFASEREAVPVRNATRIAVEERQRKQAIKEVLAQAKLSAEDIFALIPVSLGPERGEVVHAVYDVIRGKTTSYAFQKHFEEIERRASIARIELARRGLSL